MTHLLSQLTIALVRELYLFNDYILSTCLSLSALLLSGKEVPKLTSLRWHFTPQATRQSLLLPSIKPDFYTSTHVSVWSDLLSMPLPKNPRFSSIYLTPCIGRKYFLRLSTGVKYCGSKVLISELKQCNLLLKLWCWKEWAYVWWADGHSDKAGGLLDRQTGGRAPLCGPQCLSTVPHAMPPFSCPKALCYTHV